MSYEQGQKNGIAKKIVPSEYDAKGTLKSKVNFFLKNEFRFLHIREMAETAHEYEPGTSVEEFMAKLSPTLSVLKREGHIVNITVGKSLRNTFWGSPKWLDQNNNIISGHEYNKKYLVEAGNSDFKI